MRSHLTIIANGHPLVLKPDASIDIEFQNPMFNDQEMFSYSQQIPIEGNRHLLRNVEDVNADARVVDVEHTETRVIADGQPFCSGTMVMSDEEEVIDSVSMNIDASTQSFSDLIGDMQCRDVLFPPEDEDSLVIGEKIGNIQVSVKYSSEVDVSFEGSKSKTTHSKGTLSDSAASDKFEPQALGYSYPGKCVVTGNRQEAVKDAQIDYRNDNVVIVPKVETSYINVTDEYGASARYEHAKPAFFCNARISYKHRALADDGTTSDADDYEERPEEPENHGTYWVLDANRPQSGICFYVRYFLDCLFYTLGVDFDDAALDTVADFNHLCFFTTHCKYTTKVLHAGEAERYSADDEDVKSGAKKSGDVKQVIKPFFSATTRSSIYCTAAEATAYNDAHELKSTDAGYKKAGDLYDDSFSEGRTLLNCDVYADYDDSDCLFKEVNTWLSSRGCGAQMYIPKIEDKEVQDLTYTTWKYKMQGGTQNPGFNGEKEIGETKTAVVGKDDVKSIKITSTVNEASISANILKMIASPDNFPQESVSTIIESLENAFGLKFYYDYERKRVTVYMLRDLFRKRTAPRTFFGKVYEMHPVTEKITGVRMCYSNESDSKEQRNNVRDRKKDYDTSYDYIDYTKENVVTDKTYRQFYRNLSSGDMHCYIDRTTGNAYRVKIDSEYTTVNTMKPVLFEVGQWKGVEYGDCSDINEDFVTEISNSFQPVEFNDVNYRREVSAEENIDYTLDAQGQQLTGGYTNMSVTGINSQSAQPLLVAYIDEDMEHEFVKCYLDNALSSAVADILIRGVLKLTESYDPTNTDDGNSPLQSYDWGLSIAMMRGGGSDMTIDTYDYDYDHFGNARWRTKAGEYALASDTMDQWGNVYDYNGDGYIYRSYDVTLDREGAKRQINIHFLTSNADLTAAARKVSGSAARAKGWTSVSASDYCTYITGSKGLKSGNGKTYEVMYVVIQDDGTILTPSQIDSYWSEVEAAAIANKTTLKQEDYKRKKLFVKSLPIQNTTEANVLATWLHKLGEIYYGTTGTGHITMDVPVDNGIGSGERFSLKIRAFKKLDWTDDIPCNEDVVSEGTRNKIRTRGLFDTFMIDYAYFLLHRHRYKVRAIMSVAQVNDIQNHWREWWNINDKQCLINKVSCSIDNEKGLGPVELDVFSL